MRRGTLAIIRGIEEPLQPPRIHDPQAYMCESKGFPLGGTEVRSPLTDSGSAGAAPVWVHEGLPTSIHVVIGIVGLVVQWIQG